ncbi:hypothetical protein EAH80_11765 [Mycobacterium hodleri]|uniref:Transposase n=1 Tax=Mycolicibacterium hodleri TaxID=49897 RepID=A0A502E960_9MYCO|nr:hypothetical protein EAH80_11765 [Mycolicibacterium hodleri]
MDSVPKAFPAEFRADVIAVVRKWAKRRCARLRALRHLRSLAASPDQDQRTQGRCLDQTGSLVARGESVEPREARQRIKLLAEEAEVMRRAFGYLRWEVNPK